MKKTALLPAVIMLFPFYPFLFLRRRKSFTPQQWQTMDDTYAPFEFIVKVTDPKASFTYYVEKVIDGKTIKSSEKTLTPMTK